MKITRAAAIVLALGLALVPAAASATTTPTTYTKNYAGYYAISSNLINRSYSSFSATMPALPTLANYTTGVTSEVRLYSSQGQLDMQVGADPQIVSPSIWRTRFEQSGFGTAIQAEVTAVNKTCFAELSAGTFPEAVYINQPGYNNGDTIVDWYFNSGGCEIDFNSVVKFTKIAFVGAFNVSGFHPSSSPVLLTSFSGISIDGLCTVATCPHGKYVATSTGTATGTKRAVPSALNSTGGAFSVSIP